MIIHPIIFGTYTGRHTQTIPKALIVLKESSYIITFVYLIHYSGVIADMFQGYSGSDLCTTFPFLIELVVEIVIEVLISLCFGSVS